MGEMLRGTLFGIRFRCCFVFVGFVFVQNLIVILLFYQGSVMLDSITDHFECPKL